jgi:hypothetical protein
LIVVTTPPAMATPWNTTPYSGMFGDMIATHSPRPSPAAWRPPPSRRTASSSWA